MKVSTVVRGGRMAHKQPSNETEPTTTDNSTHSSAESSSSSSFEPSSSFAHHDDDADLRLIAQAEALHEKEQLLAAARLLNQVQDSNRLLLTDKHRYIINLAKECEDEIASLLVDDPTTTDAPHSHSSCWKRQGESHGKFDSMIYYKVDDRARLTCRIETPIEQSLLVPLLSVLNEVELYPDWVPSWTVPKLGIRTSRQLHQYGRANQILQVVGDVPWPFCPREVIMHAVAVDEIEQGGYIAVRLHTLPTGEEEEAAAAAAGVVVPPPESNVERVDFEGAMLVRACPSDNPVLRKSKNKYSEPLLLVSFKMFVDAHMHGFPHSFINFVTRTVIGRIWAMLLSVAQDVRDGKRPHHQHVIEGAKADFYQWMQSRIQVMFDKLKEKEEERFIAYLQS